MSSIVYNRRMVLRLKMKTMDVVVDVEEEKYSNDTDDVSESFRHDLVI